MTLRDRLSAFISAVGADIKSLGLRNPFSAYMTVSAASLTLTPAHHGMIIVLTGSGAVPITVPATGLPANFYCRVLTSSPTGWFRFVAGAGTSLQSTTPLNFAIKQSYTPADIFQVGAATYLVSGVKLTTAYMLNLISTPPTLAVSTSRTIVEAWSTGNLMEARRSSDNTSQVIGQSMSELDTAALTAFVGSNSGYYKTLYDQSGNGRHFTQATASSQPRIINAGTIELAGSRPVMRGLVAGTMMDAALPVTGQALTVGMVGLMNSGAANYARLASLGVTGSFDYNNVSYAALLDRNNSTTTIQAERNGLSYAGGTVTYGSLFTYFVRFDGTYVTTFFNGTQVSKSLLMGSFNASTLRILASTQGDGYWDGNLAELISFSAALTDTEIAALTANWKNYYNIL